MPRQFTVSMVDYSKEKSAVSMNIDVSALDTAVQSLSLATDALINGNVTATEDTTFFRFTNAYPADVNSRRERKLLVRYEDTVTFRIFTLSIPSISIGAITFKENSDEIDITVGAMATWVTAFEAIAVSPDGNTVNVLDAYVVGRSL